MARRSTRARALRLARSVAREALQRLAREVDRLAVALEPVRRAIPLREAGEWVAELEVARWVSAVEDASPDAANETADSPPAVSPKSEATSVGPHGVSLASETGTERTPSVDPLPSLALAQVAHLRARLDPQLAALRHHSQWEQADDPNEALRRTRVATRRLRAFTQLFAPMLGHKRARRLYRRLRTITRAIGPLREQCVLLEGLRAEHANAEPLTQAALEHVIAWVEPQRAKAERKTRKALAGLDAAALADELEAEIDRVCGTVLRVGEELPAWAWALLELELERAFDGMPQPEGEDAVEAWHEVRKRAKEVRYAVELLRPSLGEAYAELRRPAKTIQRALGEHHDCSVVAALLRQRRETLAKGLDVLATQLQNLDTALVQRQRSSLHRAMPALARFLVLRDRLEGGRPGAETSI